VEDIERWLVRRGIPHFIDRYGASRDVLTRAIPAPTLVFLFEVFGAAVRAAYLDALGRQTPEA
jgi:hypothetical protein